MQYEKQNISFFVYNDKIISLSNIKLIEKKFDTDEDNVTTYMIIFHYFGEAKNNTCLYVTKDEYEKLFKVILNGLSGDIDIKSANSFI